MTRAPGPRPLPALVLGALALALLAERAHAWLSAPDTELDDAYVFLRYAAHLREPGGLVWNPTGPPVWGATSLGQVALVASLRGLAPGLRDGRLLTLPSCLAALVLFPALAALCARAAPVFRRAWPDLLLWLCALLASLGYTDALFFHATSGMDTMLAALALTGGLFAVQALLTRPSPGRAALVALLGVGSLAIRPDLPALVLGPAALALLADHAQPEPRRALLVLLAATALLSGITFVSANMYFGTPLPLAAWVKQHGHDAAFGGEWFWNPYRFLLVIARAALLPLGVLALGLRREDLRAALPLILPVALVWAVLSRFNQVMGHLGRFYAPALPLVFLAAAVVVSRRLAARQRPSARRLAAGATVLATAGLALASSADRYGAARGPEPPDPRAPLVSAPSRVVDDRRAMTALAGAFSGAPPGPTLALTEHGVIGARAPQVTLLDLSGLHDVAIARRGIDTATLLAWEPDAIYLPHPDYHGLLSTLLASPRLRRDYDLYPDAFVFGLALRRTSPRAALLLARIAPAFEALHGEPLDAHTAR